MVTRIYRYKISGWLVFFLFGCICETLVIGMFVKNLPALLAGKFGLLDYVGLALVVFIFLPFGALSFLVPMTSKIVLSAYGIELLTFASVMKARSA
jgi:hypothetical protein